MSNNLSSGRETRRNTRRSNNRNGPAAPSHASVHTDLPQRLLDLAQKPLPTSDLFHSAAGSPDALDESDLPTWDHPPPYNSLPPLATIEEERFTGKLDDVMHGRRLRESRVKEKARMECRMRGDLETLRKSLQEEVEEGLVGWTELDDIVSCFEGCNRHRTMAMNILQWSARSVHSLSIERQAALQGMASYTALYHTRFAR